MDIFKNEICKLLTKRTVIILLFLIIFNPLLQVYVMHTANDDGYTPLEYSGLYKEISSLSQEDMLSELDDGKMQADTYGMTNMYDRVYNEVQACVTYEDYLDSVNEKADEISIMNKFADNGGYAVRNAKQTGHDGDTQYYRQ